MEKGKKGTKPLDRKSLKISTQNKEAKINPVSNSSGPSPRRPAATVREHGGSGSGHAGGALNPALRGGTPYGAEPGIILKPNPAAEQRGIISNGVNIF